MALRGIRLLCNTSNVRKISRFSTAAKKLENQLSENKMNAAQSEDSSTNKNHSSQTSQTSNVKAFKHFSWMSDIVPMFGVNGQQVKVICQPSEFYQNLKNEIRNAKRRVVLSSLYLGTGKLEQELVDCIREAASKAKQEQRPFEVRILLDYARGSRGVHNSRTMLLPLVRDFGETVKVSLYHTPELRGWTKTILPERWNEIVGLQHMKVYLFDDNLIMSGANLSESYFTDRQDRYILVQKCPEVARFFSKLVSAVSSISFQLADDDTVKICPTLQQHPYLGSSDGTPFKREAKRIIEEVIDPHQYQNYLRGKAVVDPSEERYNAYSNNMSGKNDIVDNESLHQEESVIDTWICPLVQMGVFGITVDDLVTESFFRRTTQDSRINLASGYFNLTEHYMKTIVKNSLAKYEILTAAPEANGFFGSSGASQYIPTAYTHIAYQFHEAVKAAGQENRVSLHEYLRPAWTFHAKGLWYYLPKEQLPSLTFIGSPNFGHRSVFRDLEAQLVIMTDNHQLRQHLHQEQEGVYSLSTPVTDDTFLRPDRQVPTWAKYLTAVIRNFF